MPVLAHYFYIKILCYGYTQLYKNMSQGEICMKNNKFANFITLLFIIALALIFLYECPFNYILGISCPGCGMTRALFALLHLDFSLAFHYHPLFPIAIILVIFFILDFLDILTLNKKIKNISLFIICSLFIIVYFVRLFTGSEIVKLDFNSSLIYKIYSAIFI